MNMPDFWYVHELTGGPSVRRKSLQREPVMTHSNQATILNVRTAGEIEATGDPASAVDRYLVESSDTAGSVALVEHIVAPRVLAAPLHRHSREDEFSVVLEGRLGVFQDGDEVVATAGDVVFKPTRTLAHVLECRGRAPADTGVDYARRNRGVVPPVSRTGRRVRPCDPAGPGRPVWL